MSFPDFLDQDSTSVARQLLGCEFVRQLNREEVRVRIVETESYDQADAASHSYKGQTPRNSVMFGPNGHLYVYFTYGMHYCCNVVTGQAGVGAGVLIRAVEPVSGQAVIQRRRPVAGVLVTNGPAKLCQALDIDKRLSGHDLRQSPLRLELGIRYRDDQVATATRVGISLAVDELRRFYVKDSAYVSKYARG